MNDVIQSLCKKMPQQMREFLNQLGLKAERSGCPGGIFNGPQVSINTLKNIFIYNFCMIPHSLIVSFNLAHFGLNQNPTGLQEAF